MKNLLFIFCLIVCYSCQDLNSHLLKEAEARITSDPDSALALLKRIERPENLDRGHYSEYILLLVRAKDKNDENVSHEIDIYDAAAYFDQHDSRRAAWANYYAAKVSFESEKSDKTISYLLKAQEWAKQESDFELLGYAYNLLGFMHQKELNITAARSDYDSSQYFFAKAGNRKNAEYINALIGVLFLYKTGEQDSSIYYYQKALNYAKQLNDSSEISFVLKGIGMVYLDMNDFENAKSCIYKSIQMDTKNQFLEYTYNILSRIYLKENRADSAVFFAEKLRTLEGKLQSTFDQFNYCLLLCEIDKHTKNYESAFANYESLYDNIYKLYTDNVQYSVEDIRQKYHTEKIQNAYNKSIIHRQFLVIILIVVFLAGLLLTRLFIYLLNRRKHEIAEAGERMEALKSILSEQNTYHDNRLKDLLLEKLGIVRKCAYITAMNNDNKSFTAKYNQIFKNDMEDMLNWKNMYPLINEIYPGIVDRIEKRNPNLTEKEKQLCYLECAQFSSNEMGFILSYTYQTIRTRRVDVRKKMGFERSDDFLDFLRGKSVEI